MNIGIAYDTASMYDIRTDGTYYDFAEQASINNLKHIIDSLGYNVELIGNTKNVLARIQNNDFDFDLIYNTVEGINSRNREGMLPSILEYYNIPYMGTDAFGLSLTLNKLFTKILAEKLGICTPKYFCADIYMTQDQLDYGLKFLHKPIILKPNFEGNSSGICVADSHLEALNMLKILLEKYKTSILCEEFIYGTEITVPVIGNESDNMLIGATTVDIQQNDDFWLDINCKVFGDYKNVPLSSKDLNEELSQISKKLFFSIGCRDFARFDFRVDNEKKIFFIEANPLPALFAGGSFDVLGPCVGLSFAETIDLMIKTSVKRLNL